MCQTVISTSRVKGWNLIWKRNSEKKCFRYFHPLFVAVCFNVTNVCYRHIEKTQRMILVVFKNTGLVVRILFYCTFFCSVCYEFRVQLMKCIFLAAIINWIQAVRQFNTSKPWEYCTYCRSVKSTYSPAKELNIDFGGNTEELVFSHCIQHPVYKHIVHNNHSNVVVVHQITEVIETKNILKYLHMHVSYSKHATRVSLPDCQCFEHYILLDNLSPTLCQISLNGTLNMTRYLSTATLCNEQKKSSAGTQEQGC